MRALLRPRETLWNQKIQKTMLRYAMLFAPFFYIVAFLILSTPSFDRVRPSPSCHVPPTGNGYEDLSGLYPGSHTHLLARFLKLAFLSFASELIATAMHVHLNIAPVFSPPIMSVERCARWLGGDTL